MAALAMAEWKEHQMIERACEWLQEHVKDYKYYDADFQDVNIDVDDLIYKFKKNDGGTIMTREEEIQQAAKIFHASSDDYTVYKKGFESGAKWADKTMIDKACDAYCKVCGHYPHTLPASICRQDCDYYSDFIKHLKNKQ